MPRANRHFLPGHVWHLTHHCHHKTSLLKFARDRRRYLRWLFEATKRFGLSMGQTIMLRPVLAKDRLSRIFDFHATTAFDFFSAMYFFIARRLFCLLRLYEFFRASCFMLIPLVRRDKPAGCLRMNG